MKLTLIKEAIIISLALSATLSIQQKDIDAYDENSTLQEQLDRVGVCVWVEPEMVEVSRAVVEPQSMYVYPHNLFYSYMYYTAITDTTSKQYELVSQATHMDDGTLQVDGCTLVAMGNYYADYAVGKKFEITFANGTVEKFMVGDIKQDAHTTNQNRATGMNNNDIIEFIIDPAYTADYVLNAGSFHVMDKYNDLVTSIVPIE